MTCAPADLDAYIGELNAHYDAIYVADMCGVSS